ncbi:hypothetical protein GCM10009648_21310 [Tsukamurella spumae]
MEVKPYTALVGWPDLVRNRPPSSGSAKKARKAIECPSINSIVGLAPPPAPPPDEPSADPEVGATVVEEFAEVTPAV